MSFKFNNLYLLDLLAQHHIVVDSIKHWRYPEPSTNGIPRRYHRSIPTFVPTTHGGETHVVMAYRPEDEKSLLTGLPARAKCSLRDNFDYRAGVRVALCRGVEEISRCVWPVTPEDAASAYMFAFGRPVPESRSFVFVPGGRCFILPSYEQAWRMCHARGLHVEYDECLHAARAEMDRVR